MKRRITIIVLFLLLGAIVNIAVAWAAAVWFDDLEHVDESAAGVATAFNDEGLVTESWWIERQQGWGTTVLVSGRYYYPPFPNSEFDDVKHPLDVLPRWANFDPPTTAFACGEAEGDIRYAMLHGWPLRSLGGALRHDFVTGGMNAYFCIELGDMFQALTEQRYLPLHPMFSGFILNTVFFALLLWLLWAVPFAARRMLRRRRRLCVQCAYPIGTSAVCSECGAAVVRQEPG